MSIQDGALVFCFWPRYAWPVPRAKLTVKMEGLNGRGTSGGFAPVNLGLNI